MFGLHEYEYSSEEVFVKDVVLDVIGVVLHKEGQQLKNETLELYSAVCAVMRIRRIRTSSIPQRRSEGNDDTCSGDWKRYSWPLRTSSRQNAVSAFKDNVELSTVATP